MIETALRHALMSARALGWPWTAPCCRRPSALVSRPLGLRWLHRGSTATTNRSRNLLRPDIEPTPWGQMADAGFVYRPRAREQKLASQWAICRDRYWCVKRASQVLETCMKQCFSTHHNGQSASRAEWCFSTSRQHPTIGETGEKSQAETVFLVVRSRKHRMGGRGAQYTSLRDNREKNHAQRFSRTSMFADHSAGITAGCDRAP